MGKYVRPEIVEYSAECYELAESGYDNKLVTLNAKNEFCYVDWTDSKSPKMEVITPGFPGVVGQLGSDAENRVAWVVRGRGVYMIDLNTKKTGHMIAGNYGRVTQVLMTDKERLLFAVVTFSGEVSIFYMYEMGIDIDHGQIGATPNAIFDPLGNNEVLIDIRNDKEPKYKGWFLSDTFFTEAKANPGKVYPGQDPLTKALMKNYVKGIADLNEKYLHQGKRLFYSWSYPVKDGPKKPVLVRWDERMEEIDVQPLLLQQTERLLPLF